MKALFLVIAIITVSQGSDWKDKARHMDKIYAKAKASCAAAHDISNIELKAIEEMDVPETRREKCISECILNESGIMEDGRFSRMGSDAIAEYLYDDDAETLNMAKAVAKRCEKAVERIKLDDSCEVAAETIKCLRRNSKQWSGKKLFKVKDY